MADAGSQLSALIIGGLLVLMARPGPWPRRAGLRFTMLAGPCDMTANALFLLATRGGDLSIVAPLAALYPVTTVILALLIDHERSAAFRWLAWPSRSRPWCSSAVSGSSFRPLL